MVNQIQNLLNYDLLVSINPNTIPESSSVALLKLDNTLELWFSTNKTWLHFKTLIKQQAITLKKKEKPWHKNCVSDRRLTEPSALEKMAERSRCQPRHPIYLTAYVTYVIPWASAESTNHSHDVAMTLLKTGAWLNTIDSTDAMVYGL